jgi:hypothetical protein
VATIQVFSTQVAVGQSFPAPALVWVIFRLTGSCLCPIAASSYAHPALAGVLPTPWLPLRSSDSLLAQTQSDGEPASPTDPKTRKKDLSVALSLRRKVVGRLQRKKTPTSFGSTGEGGTLSRSPVQEPLNASGERIGAGSGFGADGGDNPWARDESGDGRRPTRATLAKRLSFDPATVSLLLFVQSPLLEPTLTYNPLRQQGVIMLDSSSDHEEDEEDEDRDEESNEAPFSDEATPLVGGERRYTVSLL